MPPSIVTPSNVVKLIIDPPVIATVAAFCTAIVPKPKLVRAVGTLARSDKLLAMLNLVAIAVVIVVTKLGSSPIAAASSFKVSKSAGAPSTKAATSALTKAVVAN